MKIRRSEQRGKTDLGWLKSHHSFSFGGYHDPEWTQLGPIRVINDDRVDGGGGFPPHPHRDMEIVSIVLEGELSHRDSIGNGSTLRKDEVQYMSAGSGVVHSEMNPSPDQPVHFLQIWILPDRKNLPPTYAEAKPKLEPGSWTQILSPKPGTGTIKIHQDLNLYRGISTKSNPLNANALEKRSGYFQVIQGTGTINGNTIQAGDAVLPDANENLNFEGDLDLLWFDFQS